MRRILIGAPISCTYKAATGDDVAAFATEGTAVHDLLPNVNTHHHGRFTQAEGSTKQNPFTTKLKSSDLKIFYLKTDISDHLRYLYPETRLLVDMVFHIMQQSVLRSSMPNSLHDLMLLRYCVVKGSYTCARHQAM
jgi:hypothetical protein